MSAEIVHNTSEQTADNLVIPIKADGSPYQFEMLYDNASTRAYADTPAELLDCLIRRYADLTPPEQLAARLRHAVRAQVAIQALLNWDHDNLYGCTPREVDILTSTRSIPPAVDEWSSPVPLVLVDAFYQPLGQLTQPISTLADVEDPPNLIWLRTTDEHEYLVSLHNADYITLNRHLDYTA